MPSLDHQHAGSLVLRSVREISPHVPVVALEPLAAFPEKHAAECIDLYSGMFTAVFIGLSLGILPALWVVSLSSTAKRSAIKHSRDEDELEDVASLVKKSPTSLEGASHAEKSIHPNHKMAPGVAFALYVSEVLLNMNFTVVLPTSYEVAKRTSAGVAASGLIIGAHGIGFLIALPVFTFLSKRSCRKGYLLFSLLMVVGNVLYCFCVADPERYGIYSVLAVRTLTGLECGGTLLGWIVAYRANGTSTLPEVTAARIASGALGLMSGPLLSSLCHSMTGLSSVTQDVLPFALFAIAGVGFGISIYLGFPENDSIPGLLSGRSNSKPLGRPGEYLDVVLDKSWLALGLDVTMTMLRVMQRVGWEAGALFIVAEEFALGNTVAGYLVPLCLCGMLVSQPIFVALNKRLAPHTIADTLHAAELIGLSFMLRLGGPPTTSSLVAFSFGSCLYYGANMSGAALYSPFRGKNALSNHPVLNLESSSVLQMLSVSFGYTLGPVTYRWVLGRCLHQNVLVGAALALFSCQVIISRFSLPILTESSK